VDLESLKSIESIEFKNVWYKFPNESEWSLKNLNLKLAKEAVLLDIKS
jgi:ABC-type bacteriocin/lantibiotic exporter with double-glycine peptidase domain